MRTYPLSDADGVPHAFEVDCGFLTRGQACKIAESISGAVIIRRSRLFRDTDDFCEFKIGDDAFVIEEPCGDNSRYWIGLRDAKGTDSLGVVRRAFEAHESWRQPLANFFVVAVVLGAIWSAVNLQKFIAQDRCLDSGGRWEYKNSSCTREGTDG